MMAPSPRPANSHVSLARCIGLQSTSPKGLFSSTALIRSSRLRPLAVNGMSVVPVCCPLRLHSVSPCLMANTFMFVSPASDVVGLGRTDTCRCRFLSPPPARDLRHVVAVSANEFLVVDELVADGLLGVSGPGAQLGHAVEHVADQMEAIETVQHTHVERRGRGAFFPVAACVDVLVTVSPVGQPVNEGRIAMEGKDDRLVDGEERVEIVI